MFQGSGFGTSTNSTFGSFNKPATTFGASPTVFGSGGSSLFGSSAQPATGGLFGATTQAPAFGQPQTTTPSFGAFSNNTGTGLFGNNQNASTSTGLFGSTTTSAFGQAKPAFSGFGTTQTTSLFGQQPTAQAQPQSTNIFGQTNTSSTGLFGSSGGFGSTMGASTNTGTGNAKFVAVTGTDTMIKNGNSQTISTRHHCISCMKEYESKSLEELRMEDYTANRKGPQQGVQSGGLFGSTAQPSLFGTGASSSITPSTGLFGAPTENKPIFGNTSTPIGFGQTSNVFGNTGSSLFGKPATATSAFGTPTTTNTNTFAFNASTTNTNPFGSNLAQVKPFGAVQPSLFSNTTIQPSTGFGTQTPAFGSTFAAPANQTSGGGLFSQNKPAFGATNNQFTFGQTATTSAGSSFFGAKPTNTFGSPFGTTTSNATSGFGTTSTFGATNQNSSLFGNTFKTPTTNFSFGPTNTNTTLGGGSTLFGNNANKPTSLFGNSNTSTGLFGSSGFGNTGGTTFGTSNTGLGMNMPVGSLLGGSTFSTSNTAQPTSNSLNQHILALASMPFGDNPLFKKLLPSTGKAEELLKPPPGLQKNMSNGLSFKVSNNNSTKIKMKPIGPSTQTKLSLFEGLEDDPSYFQKMQMKPTIKRLTIQPRGARSPNGSNPEFPTNTLLPLENLANEGNSPRYFIPLGGPDSETLPASSSETNKQNTSTSELGMSPATSKAPASDNNDGSNTVLMTTLLQTPDNTMVELVKKQTSPPSKTPLENKENVEQSSSSNSSDSDVFEVGAAEEPHPTGIVLRRVGYFTIPSMDQLANLMEQEGRCVVDNFTVGRYNYGNIFFPDSFDVCGLNLDEIVHFRHKEVTVYPDENSKPPLGEGLNRPAQVTLDRVWPMDRKVGTPISDPRKLDDIDFEGTLRSACVKMNARFKEYRPQTGSWVFKVDHFSKYGLSDSDEDEPSVSDIKKLRLNSNPPQSFPAGPTELGLKRGLDGAWAPPPQSSATSLLTEDDQDMDDELIKTPFDLDENYQPKHLSPTTQLAHQMGASAQKVQMMKASFYPQEEDELNGDIIDYSMGSLLNVQEFDQGTKLRKSFPALRTQFKKFEEIPSPLPCQPVDVEMENSLHVMDSLSSASMIEAPLAPPLPPVKPEYKQLRCSDNGVICYGQSLTAKNNHCLADVALFKGHSFRAGWGRDNTLVSLSTHSVARTVDWSFPLNQLDYVLAGRQEPDTSPAIVQRIRILPGQDDNTSVSFQISIEEHLDTALKHSLFSENKSNNCPQIGPKAGVGALHAHCALAQRAAIADPHMFHIIACQIWELCVALWGNLPDLDTTELPGSHHSIMERRQAVSDWLEAVVRKKLHSELTTDTKTPGNMFSLLTGHCVMEACNQAHDAGDHYAALLLSQLGGADNVRVMADQQLTQWADTEADQLIDEDRLKLMMLVAGRPVFNASHRVVNVCDKLDWRRAFAVHLWYVCSPVSSVTDALIQYDAAFSDDEKPYASPPLPMYSEDVTWETSKGEPIYDVCYHLLKLFSTRGYPLAPLLNPATYSADPLDHRLSWLLLRAVESLGYFHVSSLCASNIHTMFATQLESHGMWHWAVFVLLHITDSQLRTRAVLDLLGRHVDLSTDPEKESFLINKLKIPAQWVYQAKATFSTAHFRHKEAAEYLLKAEQWNDAHKVIIQHISAKAVINEQYQYLGELLGQLAPHSKVVNGWAHQGALLLDYLSVVQQVANLVAQQDPTVGYHLERLQPQLNSLCSRIHLLPAPSALHRLCQVEIAKRAVHLIRTLLILQRGDSSQSLGMSVSVLAHLVNQLPLPEDYSKQELHELTASMVANLVK